MRSKSRVAMIIVYGDSGSSPISGYSVLVLRLRCVTCSMTQQLAQYILVDCAGFKENSD